MERLKLPVLWLVAALFLAVSTAGMAAQTANQEESPTVRGIVAFAYPEDEETKVMLRGTPRQPEAQAEARIEREEGTTRIEIKAEGLKPARQLGGDYHTYMIWAVTPEGKITSLGELVLDDGEAEIETSSSLRDFGLFATGERDSSVTEPSEMVVLESIRADRDEAKTTIVSLARGRALGQPFADDGISRNIVTVSYPEGEDIEVELEGTGRLPGASGKAEVKREEGTSRVKLEVEDMKPARLFGGDLNTYVVWAVSPQGKTDNIGSLILDDDHVEFEATTAFKDFGLIVTAEPHYMVQRPSRFIVLENRRPEDDDARVGVARIDYLTDEFTYDYTRQTLANVQEVSSYTPGYVAQARTAIELAEEAGAENHASEDLKRARESLRKAEEARMLNDDDKLEEQRRWAREAVRQAVAAQTTATEKTFELAAMQRRQENANRIAELERRIVNAANDAERERLRAEAMEKRLQMEQSGRREAAEQLREARRKAEEARREAERARLEAEIAREQARGMVSDTERRYRDLLLEIRERQEAVARAEQALRQAEERQGSLQAPAQSGASEQMTRPDNAPDQQNDEARQSAQMSDARAQLGRARENLTRAQEQADEYRKQVMAEREARERAEREADQARTQLSQSEEELKAARDRAAQAAQESQKLKQQNQQASRQLREALGDVAEVRQEVYGLVVNLPEVLFALDRAELRPQAQVMLENVARALQSVDNIRITIEGHTDTTGSAEYNRELSEQRALSVRDFLISHGVRNDLIVEVRGVGEADPIASNESESGRQMNRRVEIIVSEPPETTQAE